jgi:hypothetical protein
MISWAVGSPAASPCGETPARVITFALSPALSVSVLLSVIASIRVAAGSAALAALAACQQPGGQAPGHRGDAACGAIADA